MLVLDRALLKLIVGMSLCVSGCTLATSRPPDLPPTPQSITKEHPGGDAADPERAALERLATEPRGHKSDRFGTLSVELFDWKHWERVRLWVAPTRVAFQFGDEHYAFDAVWYLDAQGSSDPESCLSWFEKKAQPIADGYGVRIAETKIIRTHQDVRGEPRPMIVKTMEGSVESLVASDEYVGALVAYQSWPGTCLLRGFAVVAGTHRDVAVQVRDRWVAEAAPKLFWSPELHTAPATEAR